MNTVLILTLAFLCVGLGTTLRTPPTYLLQKTERNLLQLMVDTRIQQRADPERTLACFDYYMPLFDELNEQYKENYAACLDEADGLRGEIDASTQPQRDSIEKSAKSSCEALRGCSELSDSVKYFSCFVDSGKGNTEVMYEISANSAETLSDVRESYRLIQNSEYRCTNASERHYIEQTYQGNLQLQSCLRGDSEPPTSTPAPTTAPTEEPTTEEPSSETPETTDAPTEEPSSETPETTDAPTEEPSSETPETTDAPTEEPTSETEDELMPEEDIFKVNGLTWDKIRDVLRTQLKQGH